MFLRRNRRMSSDFREGAMQDIPLLTILGSFATSPSGVFYPNVTNIIGPGTALDMEVLIKERRSWKQGTSPPQTVYIGARPSRASYSSVAG